MKLKRQLSRFARLNLCAGFAGVFKGSGGVVRGREVGCVAAALLWLLLCSTIDFALASVFCFGYYNDGGFDGRCGGVLL